MKKVLTIAAALLLTATAVYAEPETKMEKSFNEMFPNAAQVKWHQDAGGYLVSFTQAGMQVKIIYSNKGKFIQSLRYYSEKDLPTNILMAVKNKYQGETIYGVTELTTANEVTYHITLAGKDAPQSITAYSNGTITDTSSAETDN